MSSRQHRTQQRTQKQCIKCLREPMNYYIQYIHMFCFYSYILTLRYFSIGKFIDPQYTDILNLGQHANISYINIGPSLKLTFIKNKSNHENCQTRQTQIENHTQPVIGSWCKELIEVICCRNDLFCEA